MRAGSKILPQVAHLRAHRGVGEFQIVQRHEKIIPIPRAAILCGAASYLSEVPKQKRGTAMKLRVVFALAVLSMAFCATGSAEKPKFTLTVHVESSDYSISCDPNYMCYGLQKLNVTIDGKKYILASEDASVVTGMGQYLAYVLKNGDYPARIVKEDAKNASEYHRVIELQVSDGVARRYTVVGEGAN
jgi:hypothetical protein